MDIHLSDLQRLLKNGKKSESFDARFEQNFNTTMSRTDICKYMTFNVVKLFIGTNILYVPLLLTTSNMTRLKHIGTRTINPQPNACARS